MTTKHTAGPWTAVRLPACAYGTIDWEIVRLRNTNQPNYNLDEKRIAVLQTDDDETQANARLIAAAPAMLAALKDADEMLSLARQYLPKSIKNTDTFRLLNCQANSVRKALKEAGAA